MHSGGGDVALLQLVRFSGDAESFRQLSGAAPFMLTQVLSVPLCMMQAGTGDLLHSRLERERASQGSPESWHRLRGRAGGFRGD